MALKGVLQREVFNSSEEKLLAVINVTKPTGRKKKPSFLTLSEFVQDDHTVAVLSRIKTMDRKESSSMYKRVKSWPLVDLKMVDCHMDGSELDLKFEKQMYKWIVANAAEKKSFIMNLFKTKHKCRLNIKFMNIDEAKLQELTQSTSSVVARTSSLEDTEEILEQEEYRELSPQEEADLEDLLKSGRENAIQDAVSFMENLSEELSELDQSNIHSLMGSEEQIEQLMEYLEGGIVEVEKMEMRLNVYDELLSGVRETMQKLSFQYNHILRQNTNLGSLYKEVDDLVSKLDLNSEIKMILHDSPLGTKSDIQDCVMAAKKLQEALNQDLGQGVSILQAVTDQTALFSDLSMAFGKKMVEYLKAQFVQSASEMTERLQVRQSGGGPSMASHGLVHSELLMYQELTTWLKECQPRLFAEIMEAYVKAFCHVYEEQLKGLFKESRDVLQIVRSSEAKKPGGFLGKIGGSTIDIRSSPMSGSMTSLSPARGTSFMSQSIADFGASASTPQESSRGPAFDKLFPVVLEQIQPVCVAEQKFLNSFFHFERNDSLGDEMDTVDGVFKGRSSRSPEERISVGSGAQHLLNKLFSTLLQEIEDFIAFGERQDSYNALYLLVSVSQRLLFAEESGGSISYLDETLKGALLHIRRLFDKLIEEKIKQIKDTKVPRGSKCGILPCVRVFEDFAERSERIVMAADRRTELDKAYQVLIDALFGTIERVAFDHPKTPHDVIKFENYNKIVDILSRLKIICLEKSRDEARKKYRSHKNDYVNTCLGRPLDKLNAFFEGIEKLKASGTKAEEVGFCLDYSKTELKKCIREYPGKEVKRGLEKLYRRVDREVSEGELQVVWGNMQSAFIQQCSKFKDLIEECYPGSNITLDFSISDLNEYFVSIARSV